MQYEVLCPWAEPNEKTIRGLQERVEDLEGKTIGLFSFHKEHGEHILREVERQIKQSFPSTRFTFIKYPKDCVDLEDDDEFKALLKDWLKDVDMVISGHGDATSCTLFLAYATIVIEKMGKPAVMLMNRHFEKVVKSGCTSRGLQMMRVVPTDIRDMSGFFDLDGVTETIVRPEIERIIDEIIGKLTTPLTEKEKATTERIGNGRKTVFAGDLTEVNNHFYKNGWIYGTPIIPPTREAVEEMLTGTDLPPDHVVETLPPMMGKATVEKIAINAVMAGCLPTYMPVLISAVKAAMAYSKTELGVALEGYTCSVASWAPLLIVNGPVRNDLHINGKVAAISPYYKANAAIARAFAFIILNIAGVRPGIEDMSFIGHEGRGGMCIAENEEECPWEPMHVYKGLEPDDSAVTLFWPNSRSLMFKGKDIPTIFKTICDNIETLGFSPGCGILMGPSNAKMLSDNGWTRKDILDYVLEYSRRPGDEVNVRWLKGNCHVPKDVLLPVEPSRTVRRIFDPDHLLLTVVGQPYYPGMTLYGGGGDHGGPKTVKIDLPSNWHELVEKYSDIVPNYADY